ncbi:MAG: methyltransferase domain-containing protein [Candidatus Sulfotelmatobacter sp.]
MKTSVASTFKGECVGVAEGYERWARTYDRTPNPILALEERQIKHILPDLRGKQVLDLACGTGRWLPELLRLGAASVVGIDCSAAMLRIARRKDATSSRIVLADCLRLPFRDSAFDFAVCSFALNHIEPLELMARGLARVMKSQGRIVISEMHPHAYANGWRPGFRDDRSAVQIETVSYLTEHVISCFQSHGLDCDELREFAFEESEYPIFAKAGKENIFEVVRNIPAIQIYEFRKVAPHPATRLPSSPRS